VLLDAVRSMRANDAFYREGRRSARQWMYLDTGTGIGTFEWVCEVLDLCPHRVRQAVGK
jgi:hypothetical protein